MQIEEQEIIILGHIMTVNIASGQELFHQSEEGIKNYLNETEILFDDITGVFSINSFCIDNLKIVVNQIDLTDDLITLSIK